MCHTQVWLSYLTTTGESIVCAANDLIHTHILTRVRMRAHTHTLTRVRMRAHTHCIRQQNVTETQRYMYNQATYVYAYNTQQLH